MICPECGSEVAHKPECGLSVPAFWVDAVTEAIGETLTLAALPGRDVLRRAATAAIETILGLVLPEEET